MWLRSPSFLLTGRSVMDQLLELLEKHRCHLRRGSQSMADFLELDFQSYVRDVRESLDVKENPLVGAEMCIMVKNLIDEIESNAVKLVEVLRLYGNGKIVNASIKAFEVFDIMKPQLMQRYSGAYRLENYYRIRGIGDKLFPLERKELFHIPYSKNYLVGTERYSMPGHPCLYLASQAELAWYECGKPQKFAIAKFSIPQEEDSYLKFIDFSEKLMPLKHSFFCWFHNEKDKLAVQKYLLKYIYTYPLRAACSVVVEHHGAKFIEEYIIPQLLLQWVRNDEDFDGIRYESCSSSDDVKSFGGHNIVLVTKQFDADGYDIKLRNCIRISSPQVFDFSPLKRVLSRLKGKRISKDPFLWGMESTPDDFEQI